MAEREQATEKHLATIRYVSNSLYNLLQKHSPQTIELAHDVIQETRKAGHDPYPTAEMLRLGVGNKVFDAENLPQILIVLKQTATAGHDPHQLALHLRKGLEKKTFNPENLAGILDVASRHAEKGKNPVALAAALRTVQPTPENIQALKDAEPHMLRAYEFLHGVKDIEDHKRVSGPLFAYVLRSWKKNPALLKKEAFWASAKIYTKQLKQFKTKLK